VGRWQKYYDKVLPVNAPPFVGTVWVGYQPLMQTTDNRQPRRFPAWERFAIWKPVGSGADLSELYPHVATHVCLRELVRTRLQGDKTLGREVSLYLTNYTVGREVFERYDGETFPPGVQIVGLPTTLREPDDVHASHPVVELL